MKPLDIKTLRLAIKQYEASVLINHIGDVKFELTYHIETLCYLLRAAVRIPAEVLSDRKVVASYPTNLWQYIRKALGLKYLKTDVRVSEHLLYPTIKVPRGYSEVRLHVASEVTTDWSCD